MEVAQRQRSIFKDITIYGLGYALTKILFVFFTPLLSHYLSTKEFGLIAMIDSFGIIISSIFSFGIGSSFWLTYNKLTDDRQKKDCVTSAAIFLSASFVIAGIIFHTIQISTPWSPIDLEYRHLVYLVVAQVALQNVSTILAITFQLAQKPKQYVFMLLLQDIIYILVACLCLFVFRWKISAIFVAATISQIGVVLFACTKMKLTTWSFQKKYVWSMMREGLYFMPSMFFMFVLTQSNRHVISHFIDRSFVGIFNMGFSLASASNLIFLAIETAWYPFFMGYFGRKRSFTPILQSSVRIFMLAGSLFVGCFFIFSRFVVHYFIDPGFSKSMWPIGFVSLGFFFRTLYVLLLPPIYFQEKTKWTFPIQLLSSIVGFSCTYFMIRFLGEWGSYLAYPVGFFSMVLFQIFANNRIEKNDRIAVSTSVCIASLLIVFSSMALQILSTILHPIAMLPLGFTLLAITTAMVYSYLKEDLRLLKASKGAN